MTTIWDIITALGTIVATISIIGAFWLYRIQKRDEYLIKVRESLQLLSNGIGELDSILNFELAYEMAYDLVYSESSRYTIESLYEICNKAIKDDRHKSEAVIKEIENTLDVFGTAFTGPLATKYGALISEIKKSSTCFYPNYKGLFRFSKTCVEFMNRIFANYKKLVLDEETIARSLIYDHMIKDCDEWTSIPQFKKKLLDHLINVTEFVRKRHHQSDVDHLVALVDLVYSRHIELTTQEWIDLSRKCRKINMLPYEDTESYPVDFREAEKCFRSIFSHDDIANYSAHVIIIENSNSN